VPKLTGRHRQVPNSTFNFESTPSSIAITRWGIWRQPIIEFHATGGLDALDRGDVPICDTEEQWVETLLLNAEAVYRTKPPLRFEFNKHMLHWIFQGHDSVFTHAGLHPSNILLRDDNTVVIIDWA